jgi:hypothetical protein
MDRRELQRAYRKGDLVQVEHQDKSMFIACPTGQAVVMKASQWHCQALKSIGGDLPEGCDPYYQILKVMSSGKTFYNVHSHNVVLLSGNEETQS